MCLVWMAEELAETGMHITGKVRGNISGDFFVLRNEHLLPPGEDQRHPFCLKQASVIVSEFD